MRVRELLRERRRVVTVRTGTPVHEAARILMEHRIGGVPVLDDKGLLSGFVAERDIVRAMHTGGQQAPGLPVERVMQRPPPVCNADDTLQELMGSMTEERNRHVVVMSDGNIDGIVSVGDLVKHRLEQLETETGVLRDYVAAQRAHSAG